MNLQRLLVALGCVFGAFVAQAAIVRGGGGHTNDGGGSEVSVFIVEDDGPTVASSQQRWLGGTWNFAAVPQQAQLDADPELDDCVIGGLALIACDYTVGPGESRRLQVTGSSAPGPINTFSVDGNPIPHLKIEWRVFEAIENDPTPILHKTFTFDDQNPNATSWPALLNLNDLPFAPTVLSFNVMWTFTLPEGFSFYESSGLCAGDARTCGTNKGREYVIQSGTLLTIDEDSLPADETPPVTSASQFPLPNVNGWNKSPVVVTITASDEADGSGLAFISYQEGADTNSSESSSVTLNVDSGGSTPISYFAEDLDGNASTINSLTVNIDITDPGISASTAPPPNADGWNNSAVTVSFQCSDAPSGIESCPSSQALSAETSGTLVSGTAVDKAGNTKSDSATVKIDMTDPSIAGSATPAANAAGWNKTNVNVHFTCGDSLSGIKSCTPDAVLSANAAGQSAAGTAADHAGNTASTTISGINIDNVSPTVSVTGVADDATYAPGAVPTAGCSTTDGLSGVATAATLALTGGTSNGVGTFTANCSGALDNAGNGGSASANYKVQYSYSGFFSPVDNLPYLNGVKAGQAVPVKFSLGGNYGLDILQGTPQSLKVQCNSSLPMDDIEQTVAAGGSSLSYDLSTGQYAYVWKTDKSYKGTCRSLIVTLDDGTVHTALFKFN